MNLRFATQSIRIRISTEELAQLQAGKSLGLEVSLPRGHSFRAKVNQSNAEWQFDSDPTGLWFSIPRAELELLAQGAPSKEGMMHVFDTHHGELQISLEVDVKTGRKRE
ncbi:MAG: hypothetical protein AB7T07_14520 [Steroidobacteraceae bacterium]